MLKLGGAEVGGSSTKQRSRSGRRAPSGGLSVIKSKKMPIPLSPRFDLFVASPDDDVAWVNGYLLREVGVPRERVATLADLPPGVPWVRALEELVSDHYARSGRAGAFRGVARCRQRLIHFVGGVH